MALNNAGSGIGIEGTATGILVGKCSAIGAGIDGIFSDGATAEVSKCDAFANAVFDLHDATGCANTTWETNRHRTEFNSCEQ